FFSSRRRHTRCLSDWSSDVCSSDLLGNCALNFSVHCAGSDVPEDGGFRAARLAAWIVPWPFAGHDLWNGGAVRPHLPRGHSHVWQAAHVAGDPTLAQVCVVREHGAIAALESFAP